MSSSKWQDTDGGFDNTGVWVRAGSESERWRDFEYASSLTQRVLFRYSTEFRYSCVTPSEYIRGGDSGDELAVRLISGPDRIY